jgi:hypothetical protein
LQHLKNGEMEPKEKRAATLQDYALLDAPWPGAAWLGSHPTP